MSKTIKLFEKYKKPQLVIVRHKTKSKPSFFPLLFTPFLLFPFGRKRKRKNEEVEAWICMRGGEWPDGLMGKVFFGDPHFSSPPCCFCAKQLPRERWKKLGRGRWTKKVWWVSGICPYISKFVHFSSQAGRSHRATQTRCLLRRPNGKLFLAAVGPAGAAWILVRVFTRGLWYILRPLHQLDCVWGFLFALIPWLKSRISFLGKMQMQTKAVDWNKSGKAFSRKTVGLFDKD